MQIKHILPAALIAFAGASSFAAGLGTELTEQPQAQSTLTREQVRAETRAAMARGELSPSAYDEQESTVLARQSGQGRQASRAEARAETAAYLRAHPMDRSDADSYRAGR